MSHVFIGVTINEDTLKQIEDRRGLVSRSAYVNHILVKYFDNKKEKMLGGKTKQEQTSGGDLF